MPTRMPVYEVLNHDLFQLIQSQLPRAVQERKLQLNVSSDPYHLRTYARFIDERGRVFECQLEDMDVGGRKLALKIPDTFVAHLCAVL